jgi:hypothetical protein
LVALPVTGGANGAFVAGTPLPLFSHATSIRAPDLNEFSYAVSADGQRFLVLSRPDVEEGIHVPTNWTQQDVNDHRASCSPKLDFMTLALGKVDSSAVLAAFLIFSQGAALAQSIPAAIFTDPPPDKAHPAKMTVVHIPTHGLLINGVVYQASGAGLHPTIRDLPRPAGQ